MSSYGVTSFMSISMMSYGVTSLKSIITLYIQKLKFNCNGVGSDYSPIPNMKIIIGPLCMICIILAHVQHEKTGKVSNGNQEAMAHNCVLDTNPTTSNTI